MVYLVIRRSDTSVFQAHRDDPEGRYNPEAFEIKQWYGDVPELHDPDRRDEDGNPDPIYSYDPTLDDPDYLTFLQTKIDFDALADKATSEIEWLDEVIPLIPSMTGAEVRNVVLRLAREQREELKAWRYIFRRLL